MATLKDVAKEVGVSVATVSYVLNDKGSVSKKVSDQVRKAVKKLNYRPSRIAQSMRTGFTQSIGFMLPDLTNPFFPELAQMVENAARDRRVSVLLVDSQNLPAVEEEGLALFQQHAVDGVILCPVGHKKPAALAALDILENENLPGRVAKLAPYFEEGLHQFKGLSHISDVRNFGFAGALTIQAIKGEPARRPYEIAMRMWDKGFYVRYGGDTIQLGLPFVIEKDQIDSLLTALKESLE